MDITYLGGASFLLKGERVVAINPAQKARAADVLLHSSRQHDRTLIVDGPGEYEIGGVLIVTEETGPRASGLFSHAVATQGLNVVHLGTRVHDLTERQITAFGPVDVLILSADDVQAAQKAVQALEPRVVLPFGPRATELSSALGARRLEPEARFSWNGSGTPPKVVLLKKKASGGKKRAA